MQTPEPETVPTADTLAELEGRLDELWESYLALLDQYTKAHHEMKCHMSSGFLALARAQSSAPPGKRYGRDWYDERMKTCQRITVDEPPGNREGDPTRTTTGFPSLSVHITQEALHEHTLLHVDGSNFEISTEEAEQQPSPPGTPEAESKPDSVEEDKPHDAKLDHSNGKRTPVNPLQWYGMFTPAELKRAQQSFSALMSVPEQSNQKAANCTESPISSAVNAARGLREVEAELRKTRKAVRKTEKAQSAVAA